MFHILIMIILIIKDQKGISKGETQEVVVWFLMLKLLTHPPSQKIAGDSAWARQQVLSTDEC